MVTETATKEALGLTSEEAAALTAEGKSNTVGKKNGRGYLSIVCENLLTFFNLLYAIVTVVLISFGLFKSLGYLIVVIPNIAIATFQAIRAKRLVNKLAVAKDPVAKVYRDGELVEIPASGICLGDVTVIEAGKQILADGVVLSGIAEANESMLTGESDAVKKTEGASVLSGSFLVSGAITVRVTAVGRDSYVHKIEKAAKNFKAPVSNLFRDLKNLIKYIGIFMIPMAPLLFFTNRAVYDNLPMTVEKTAGSLVQMIPAGAYLLITLALSLAVITLSKKRVLVQDMYSIEMLAAADTVCLDKTGTITDGTMTVTDVIPLGSHTAEEAALLMAKIEGTEQSVNNTSAALIERFGRNTDEEALEKLPFSSARKYSAVRFASGSYAVGAPHFVPAPVDEAAEEIIAVRAAVGERVLLLSKLEDGISPENAGSGEPIALIAISDRIRPNAAETIANFQSRGVTVRIISGDHPATVSAIAARVGVNNADRYLSCEGLSDEELSSVAEEYAVFGRVTPEQKILLVKTLRAAGHTVAMTGDGVNDTLALKESDCAIAMGDGSEMAQKVSQIVLLDSDFGVLPDVVREGRRIINNVRMSAVLFLMKTVYTVLLSVFSILFAVGYPHGTEQFIPIELIVIGMASLLLTLEPNYNRSTGSFIATVLKKSIPNAVLMFLPTAALLLLKKSGILPGEVAIALAALSVTFVAFVNLVFLCRPFTRWRAGVVGMAAVGLAAIYPAEALLFGDVMSLLPAFKAPGALLLTALFGLGFAVLSHLAVIFYRYRKALPTAPSRKTKQG